MMDILTWLLMGHLVGDWLLQNDWMAKGKKQGLVTIAGMVHFTIYTISVLGALCLFSEVRRPLLHFIISVVIVFVSHWLIDATNIVERWIHFYRQSDNTMMRVMVDQTLHIVVLAVLATYLISLS
jgi:hypothetical protein